MPSWQAGRRLVVAVHARRRRRRRRRRRGEKRDLCVERSGTGRRPASTPLGVRRTARRALDFLRFLRARVVARTRVDRSCFCAPPPVNRPEQIGPVAAHNVHAPRLRRTRELLQVGFERGRRDVQIFGASRRPADVSHVTRAASTTCPKKVRPGAGAERTPSDSGN